MTTDEQQAGKYRVRVISGVARPINERGGDSVKACEYARMTYGVPGAEIGRRVTVGGKPGIIAADRGHYIGVNFDTDKPGVIRNAHPTSEVEYGDMGEVRRMTRSQRRYQDLLDHITAQQYTPKDYTAEQCEAIADKLSGDDLELYNLLRLEAAYLSGIVSAQEETIEQKDKHIKRLGGVLPGAKHRHSGDGVSGE